MGDEPGLSILFVCTGNTCRSPMAEALLIDMLAKKFGCERSELIGRGIEVASAGLAAEHGYPASPEAVELLAEEGIDLSNHHSQPLTGPLLDRVDYVFTMTNQHRNIILDHRPELEDRVHVLGMSGKDIPDPFGGNPTVYRQCREIIEQSLRSIVEKISVSE